MKLAGLEAIKHMALKQGQLIFQPVIILAMSLASVKAARVNRLKF